MTGSAGISLIFALVLFLIPFAQEINLSGILSFKAKIDKVKEEVSDLKAELISQISQQNTLISTAINVKNTNSLSLHIPGLTEASQAEQKILENRPNARIRLDSKTDEILISFQNMDDLELATTMAGLRIKLEHALRSYFGHSTNLMPKSDRRFVSLGSMWREYLTQHPEKKFLDQAMRFVMDVGNAGAHGQVVPLETAVEAHNLAEEILSVIGNQEAEANL